ncbi:hypothetical protein Tco_0218603 [Tanacetum coccineum]
MLRDLWDPELLGLDREMHYHSCTSRLICRDGVYQLRKRLCRTTAWSLIRGRRMYLESLAMEEGVINSQLYDAHRSDGMREARLSLPLGHNRWMLIPYHSRADQEETDSDFRAAEMGGGGGGGVKKSDYRRSEAVSRDPKIVKSLKAQIDRATETAGPANDPAKPELQRSR